MQALESIVGKAAAGDASAVDELIRGIQDFVYRLALRMLGDPTDAQDATQEILIRVITQLGTFRYEAAFTTWVYRVATNHLLNARAGQMEHRGLDFDGLEALIDKGLAEQMEPSEDRLLKKELVLGCTQAMLLCLDREHRIALVLGDIFELTSDEAVFVLEVPGATYRKRLERARKRVIAFMQAKCGVYNAAAPCRCSKLVAFAVRSGMVVPDKLRLATHAVREPAREDYDELVGLMDVAGIYQSQPKFSAPDSLLVELRRLLGPRATST